MFTFAPTDKGRQSRAQLLEISLQLFREKGFDATTMLEIAAAADMALGAFYYHFPSKDAIVLAYYQRVQDEHAHRVQAALPAVSSMRDRLGAVMHSKLDILRHDREFMGALLRYTGNPDHPLSFLGKSTSAIREASTALFREALAPERLPADIGQLLPLLLWALQMGILLYFLYDKSEGQQRTRRLTDRALDLTVRIISGAKIPVFRPVRKALRGLLLEAGLILEPAVAFAPSAAQEN